ncbi:hypothetical protein Sste5346_005269 [Sporothrix stenoceras]|uniref:2EXR domain-containing protein n=1 Tax=Sporothrix stenoceras TaxID=5173 RepID=A0ABR3Z5H5_9PEZI
MQTALFIRQNPPIRAGPPLPFADELRRAARDEEETPVPESAPEPAEEEAEAPTNTATPDNDTEPSNVTTPPPPSKPRVTFSSLPAEIRSAIWTESLPRRVIGLRPLVPDEAEIAATSNLGVVAAAGGTIQYGRAVPTGARAGAGSRMPQAMASTCFESRAAAMRSGRWTIGAEGQPVWFDPRRDTILLNSRRPVDYYLLGRATRGDGSRTPPRNVMDPPEAPGLPAEEEVSIWRVPQPGPPAPPPPGPPPPLAPVASSSEDDSEPAPRALNPQSTVSIADLAQHQLIGCLDEAVRSGGGIAVEHELLRSHVGRSIFPLLQRVAEAAAQRPQSPPPQLMVYFDEIVVSGTREQAVASGLFGSAASSEEQMFFVPLSDRKTLQRIHALSKVRPLRERTNEVRVTDSSESTGSEGRAHLRGRLGGLRIGNAGFLRELLRPSHTIQNLRILAMRYLYHMAQWRADLVDEPSELLIGRAMDAGMPPLEQAILFRFKEE